MSSAFASPTRSTSAPSGGSTSVEHRSTWAAAIILAFVALVQGIFFAHVALHRFVDGDEGFYLLASRLVLEHKRPYLDFFYTQAPLLPYVYGLWMRFAGVTWISAKLFAALLTALLGTLVCKHVHDETRNWLAALAAVLLFSTSTLIFGFFPIAKTYSLAGLFLFAAYVAVSRILATSPRWLIGAGGLLFGLSVETRSYLVLLTPLFLWWILRNSDAKRKRAVVLWFLGGMVVGNLPAIYLFFSSPSAFVFNNLGYHAVRSQSGVIGMWKEKFFALLVTFLGRTESNGRQTSLVFFVSLALLSRMPKTSAPRLAFQLAVGIGLISLLPTPVHPQYFCLCIPFLLVTSVCGSHEFLTTRWARRTTVVTSTACVLAVACYIAASVHDFRRYLVTGSDVAGVEPGLERDFRLEHVLAVSRAIDQVAAPGEAVASFWPGYIFQSHAEPFPGLENDFALPIADQLTSEQRRRYHVLSPAEVEADFAVHTPRIVVLREHIITPTDVEFRRKLRLLEDRFRDSLALDGYRHLSSVGDLSIYEFFQSPEAKN